MKHIWPFGGSHLGGYTFLKALFTSIICLPDSMPPCFKADIPKKYSKNSTDIGSYHHVLHYFRKLFTKATFASLIICIYLKLLKSYKASKMTTLKNYTKCNIFGIRECPLRGTNHTFLKSPFHEQHLPCRYASNLNHLKIIKL